MSMTIYLVIDHQNFPVYNRKKSFTCTTHRLYPFSRLHIRRAQEYIAITPVDFRHRFTMEAKVGTALDTGFMGTTKYELDNLLEKHYNPARHDITGVFEADRVDTNTNERTHCVVMICEQYVISFPHTLLSQTYSTNPIHRKHTKIESRPPRPPQSDQRRSVTANFCYFFFMLNPLLGKQTDLRRLLQSLRQWQLHRKHRPSPKPRRQLSRRLSSFVRSRYMVRFQTHLRHAGNTDGRRPVRNQAWIMCLAGV